MRQNSEHIRKRAFEYGKMQLQKIKDDAKVMKEVTGHQIGLIKDDIPVDIQERSSLYRIWSVIDEVQRELNLKHLPVKTLNSLRVNLDVIQEEVTILSKSGRNDDRSYAYKLQEKIRSARSSLENKFLEVQ